MSQAWSTRFLAWCHLSFNLILMWSENIAHEHLIGFKIHKRNFSHDILCVFNLIIMLLEEIADKHFICFMIFQFEFSHGFLYLIWIQCKENIGWGRDMFRISNQDLSHYVFLCFNLILMVTKNIAVEHVIFLRIYKFDFSHDVFWNCNCVLCYQERIAAEHIICFMIFK